MTKPTHTLPTLLAGLLVALLSLAGVAAAGASETASRAPAFGVATDWAGDVPGQLARVKAEAGQAPRYLNQYTSLAAPGFDVSFAEAAQAAGATPIYTFEPWLAAGQVDQPQTSLRALLAGRYDAQFSSWARAAKAFGRPVLFRFAPEANGDWTPWSPGVDGNSAQQFVRLWRHVHALFAAQGAGNVKWVWSVTVDYPGSTSIAALYPGDRYVDWLAVDGYNWGPTGPPQAWQSPGQVFSQTLRELRRLSPRHQKPIMLSEVSSSETGGSKAAWVSSFFSWLRSAPDVHAFIWFDFDKEQDWRIASSPAASQAFRNGLAALARTSGR